MTFHEKLFDLVVDEPGFYGAALDVLVAWGEVPGLRLNAQSCKVPLIRQLCTEALERIGKPLKTPSDAPEERPVQLSLF